MSNQMTEVSLTNKILRKVFLNMTFGLLISFITSLYLNLYNVRLLYAIASTKASVLLFIGMIAMVLSLSMGINKMSAVTARVIFFVYSMLMGLTLSTVGIIYDPSSILLTFLVTFVIFMVTTIYGYTTQEDLSGYSRFFTIGLISLIVMGLINMFVGSHMIYWIETVFGIVIFSGLIAFDVNRIKAMTMELYYEDQESIDKLGIIGALQLYLDFVNLFLFLLRIFGKKR